MVPAAAGYIAATARYIPRSSSRSNILNSSSHHGRTEECSYYGHSYRHYNHSGMHPLLVLQLLAAKPLGGGKSYGQWVFLQLLLFLCAVGIVKCGVCSTSSQPLASFPYQSHVTFCVTIQWASENLILCGYQH